MIKLFNTFILTTFLLSFAVLAGETRDIQSKSTFKNLDEDKNGYVSQYETRDKHRVFYFYPRADKNSDGHLDEVEFSAFEIETPEWK